MIESLQSRHDTTISLRKRLIDDLFACCAMQTTAVHADHQAFLCNAPDNRTAATLTCYVALLS